MVQTQGRLWRRLVGHDTGDTRHSPAIGTEWCYGTQGNRKGAKKMKWNEITILFLRFYTIFKLKSFKIPFFTPTSIVFFLFYVPLKASTHSNDPTLQLVTMVTWCLCWTGADIWLFLTLLFLLKLMFCQILFWRTKGNYWEVIEKKMFLVFFF